MAETIVAELLECTICLDVPASPIHTCSNGHIICGFCVEKITQCGLCQCGQLRISQLAERLSRQHDFKSRCPYYDAGCHNLIASAEVKDHVQKCYRRNALCNEFKNEVCKDVSIPLKNFVQHLKDKHGSGHTSNTLLILKSWFYAVDKIPKNQTWPLLINELHGKSFLRHCCIRDGVFHIWMTVLGDKEEASKYMHEMTSEKKLDGSNKKMKCSWTMPVLAYHDVSDFKKPDPQFISFPVASLIQFCQTEEEEGGSAKYTFTTSHRIF